MMTFIPSAMLIAAGGIGSGRLLPSVARPVKKDCHSEFGAVDSPFQLHPWKKAPPGRQPSSRFAASRFAKSSIVRAPVSSHCGVLKKMVPTRRGDRT
jgi:hypothetical protein